MKRKKVEKQNQNSKKLLEDINSVVNKFNSGDDQSEKEATGDMMRRQGSANLKAAAVKTLGDVVSKYKELIAQGKYNIVISSLKRLTEDVDEIINEMGIDSQSNFGSGVRDPKEYEALSPTPSTGSYRIDPKAMKNKIMDFVSKATQMKKLLDSNKILDAFKIYRGAIHEEYIQEINIPPNRNKVSANFRIDDKQKIKKFEPFLMSFKKLNSNEQSELINLLSSKDSENIKKIADELATQ